MIVFAAAGAGLFMAGCTSDVMPDRRYIPIAKNDPVFIEEKFDDQRVAPPAAVAEKKDTFKYEPMTDAVSSGGVDSAPAVKGSKKSTVSANGGVYVVKRGDTPERIARRHGVKLSAFMSANNLDEASARRLKIGQKLVIPGKGAAVAVKNNAPKVKKSEPVQTPALDGGKYTVKSGDTPERIARRYKVKLSDLMKANNLNETSARGLQIGQKLVIPGKEVAPVASVPVEEKNVVPAVDANVTPGPAPVDVPAQPNNDVFGKDVIGEADAVTEKTVSVGSEDSIESYEIPADTTFAELAAQKNIPEAELRKLNPHIESLTKDTLIFLPKTKK